MKKALSSLMISTLLAGTLVIFLPSTPAKASDHPRLDAAIEKLEDAIAYMRAAPHNFGGHKAAAIADCEKALKQLRKAITHREKHEHKK
jgi:hypothetical protein